MSAWSIIGGAAGGVVQGVGGIFSIVAKRKEIKGMYRQMWADIRQSEEREKALLFNADLEVIRANAKALSIITNQDIKQEVSRHRLAVMTLELSNRGVELTGSPLLAVTSAISDMGADYSEAQRQADIIEIEGQTRHDMMDRGAGIEYENRGLIGLGWKNRIKGAEWGMAAQGMSSISSFLGAGGAAAGAASNSGSMLSNMGSTYTTASAAPVAPAATQ